MQVMEIDLNDGFDTFTEKTDEGEIIWKYKNVYSMVIGEPKVYKKLPSFDHWIDEEVRIKPDGDRGATLNRFILLLEKHEFNKLRAIDRKTEKKYSEGYPPFTFGIGRLQKEICEKNNIKIGPYIRSLIDKDLIERGLL